MFFDFSFLAFVQLAPDNNNWNFFHLFLRFRFIVKHIIYTRLLGFNQLRYGDLASQEEDPK